MTLAAQITATGITSPSYADIYAQFQFQYQAIFGSDAVIDPDSQDGQMLAIFAQATYDANQTMIAVFNQFSPATAQGTGLASIVKINGLKKLSSSASTATVTIVGQANTVITNGIVSDQAGTNRWDLPATVTIPGSGTIDVLATCDVQGAIAAPANTLTKIVTPTRGWQTANNAAAASPGAPVETDSALRQRQSISTAIPANSVIDALRGAVGNLANVQRYFVYENATSATDANGIPANSISAVIDGGNPTDIGQTIADYKTPGTPTYGTSTVIAADPLGIPIAINYFQLADIQVFAAITIKALAGYQSGTGALLVAAVAAYINALLIGGDVFLNKLYAPAALNGGAAVNSSGQTQAALDVLSTTYNVTAITIGFSAGSLGSSDLTVAFNQAAASASPNIALTVI